MCIPVYRDDVPNPFAVFPATIIFPSDHFFDQGERVFEIVVIFLWFGFVGISGVLRTAPRIPGYPEERKTQKAGEALNGDSGATTIPSPLRSHLLPSDGQL
jgi:hypothetical protein